MSGVFGTVRIVVFVWLVLGGVGSAWTAGASTESIETEPLGFWEARRLLSEADDALAQARTGRAGSATEAARAVALYARVAMGRPDGSRHRERALWGAVWTSLLDDAATTVADSRARRTTRDWLTRYLDEAENPEPSARTLLQLLDRVDAAERRARAVPTLVEIESTPPVIVEPAPARVNAPTREQLRERDRAIEALREQLAATRAEVAEKQRTIERLQRLLRDDG